MSPKADTELSPHMQVWVTAIALVVGFLCGLAVSYIGFRPSLEALKETSRQLDQVRRMEEGDHRLIRILAGNDPARYQQSVGQFGVELQQHFKVLTDEASPGAGTSAPTPAPGSRP